MCSFLIRPFPGAVNLLQTTHSFPGLRPSLMSSVRLVPKHPSIFPANYQVWSWAREEEKASSSAGNERKGNDEVGGYSNEKTWRFLGCKQMKLLCVYDFFYRKGYPSNLPCLKGYPAFLMPLIQGTSDKHRNISPEFHFYLKPIKINYSFPEKLGD